MAAGVLKIATCQFAVSASIKRNANQIRHFMRRAKKSKADIVHFSECALSGYAGFDFKTPDSIDWPRLKQQTKNIMALAAKLRLWVVLGSTHKLTGKHKPHNSLYLIAPNGKLLDRYDKRFCTMADLKNYTPGDHFVNFTVKGVKCSLLICFDLRFPEIYRQMYTQKVDCILQSFYNARQKGPSIHTQIMRQTMQCRAATNYLWASCTNSSGYYAPYPSHFIQPDGKIVRQLKPNRAGMMVNTVNLNEKFYDPMANFRDMAIAGKFGNISKKITDKRSKNTKIL
ncbi:MAG: carbon-nitrogen hydrolase family protein [Sedimentisphaerales bacterium]|jgi:predicted amidohydrolase|nr:carbon-nitrogen hydrolase family protein [Sedimentisphaerales bacterium]